MPIPGPGKALCGAQRTNQPPGVTCRLVAGHDTDHLGIGHCKRHLGNTPTHEAAALREQATRELRRLLPDASPVANPLLALQQLAGRVTAWLDLLESKVADMGEWRYQDDKGAEQLRSEVALFERAMTECRQVLTACGRLSIDERLAAIDEQVAGAVVAVIMGTLADLKLDAPVHAQAIEIVERRLQALEV